MKFTAIVVSFYRWKYLEKYLESFRNQYPEQRIIVGDNGGKHKKKKKICKKYNAEYNKLPFDCGLCVARNRLVKKVKTKYTFIGDDDFYFDGRGNLKKMVELLEATDLDLIGGRIEEGGKIRNYQGYMEYDNRRLLYQRLELKNFKKEVGIKYKECDITFNSFIARTEMLKSVKWDENIKVAYEHSSFFLDIKKEGYKVAFTPDSVIVHKPNSVRLLPKEKKKYRKYRGRKQDKKRFFEKYNLRFAKDMGGRLDFFKRETIDDIDFIIVTFLRKEALRKLLFSIARSYPFAKITIADQGRDFNTQEYKKLWSDLYDEGLQVKPTAYNLDFDCGLSKARNFLVKYTDRKYVLLLDDDLTFTEETDISKFKKILEKEKEAGIVGGVVKEKNGQEIHYEHRWKRDGKDLWHIPDGEKWKEIEGIRCKETGSVLNFALMRREMLDYVKWDEELKIGGEHTDFMLRVKETDWKIFYTPEVSVKTTREENSREYKNLRKRKKFLKRLLKKRGLKRIIYLNKRVYELSDNKLKKYRTNEDYKGEN